MKERVLALRREHPGQYGNIACVRTNTQKYLPNYFRKAQLTKLFFLFPVRALPKARTPCPFKLALHDAASKQSWAPLHAINFVSAFLRAQWAVPLVPSCRHRSGARTPGQLVVMDAWGCAEAVMCVSAE